MILPSLLNLGSSNLPFVQANKIRITNIVSLFSAFIAAIYTLNYIFILAQPLVALINSMFTIAYLIPVFLNARNLPKQAKTCFFLVLMLHLVICTNLLVTNASGFHLYYFLVPTGAFLLYDLQDKKEKITLSILAIILFLYCENTLNSSPLIILSIEMNNLIYQSVVLINMIEVIIVLIIFVNQIEKNEQQLRLQATTDSLTGIANRRHFFNHSSLLYAQAAKENRPLSLIILNFDNFKQINNKYGYFTGDLCLIEICKLVARHIRTQDFFARLEGKEFVLILTETTSIEANNIAEKLRAIIAEQKIPVIGETHFQCTVSMGIATKTEKIQGLRAMLNHADKALNLAKEQGKNRIVTYPIAISPEVASL